MSEVKQKPDSNIHRTATNELVSIYAIYDSHEMLTKIGNHIRDLGLRSIHMSII